MYEISFFRKKNGSFTYAVTPDKTGSVLPSPGEWKPWFSQNVHPEFAIEGCALAGWESAFREHGYYICPRD